MAAGCLLPGLSPFDPITLHFCYSILLDSLRLQRACMQSRPESVLPDKQSYLITTCLDDQEGKEEKQKLSSIPLPWQTPNHPSPLGMPPSTHKTLCEQLAKPCVKTLQDVLSKFMALMAEKLSCLDDASTAVVEHIALCGDILEEGLAAVDACMEGIEDAAATLPISLARQQALPATSSPPSPSSLDRIPPTGAKRQKLGESEPNRASSTSIWDEEPTLRWAPIHVSNKKFRNLNLAEKKE